MPSDSALLPSRRCAALLATLLTLLGQLAGAAGTPAGTVISNQASATAAGELYLSAPVETLVRARCALNVTPDGSAATPAYRVGIAPGGESVLPYRLVNSGNVAARFALSWQVAPGSAFMPGGARVVRDVNGNGLLDLGEPVVHDLSVPVDGAADLLLVVQAPAGAQGSAFMGLTAGCADGGASDTDNVAAVRVSGGAELQIEKHFAPAVLSPGDSTLVTLRVRNLGSQPSGEAEVSDLLDIPELRGMTLVPGSAVNPLGRLSVAAAGASGALSWRLPPLRPGQVTDLTFRMQAAPDAQPGARVNTAYLSLTPGVPPLKTEASVLIRPRLGVLIGPAGNAAAEPGGEGSADDRQTRTFGVQGQATCFTHAVRNTGNVADRFTLGGQFTLGSGLIVWRDAQGAELPQPLALDAGEEQSVQACLTVTAREGGAARARLSASSELGAAPNHTEDLLTLVDPRAPELLKTVTPAGTVPVGELLTYTLRAVNPYDAALTNVMLRDTLPAGLTFVGASDGGTFDAFTRTVTWRFPALSPGGRLSVTVQARVNGDVPDDTRLENTFSLGSDELPSPVPSAPVPSNVYSSALLLSKAATPQAVVVGDRVTFTVTLRNASRVAALQGGTLLDTPPTGLTYLPGTATVDGRPGPDPQPQPGGALLWPVEALPAGGTRTLTYAMRVTPHAAPTLVNVAAARMEAPNGAVTRSSEARASVQVRPGVFAAQAELNGQVFVDRNRDGTFTPDLDTPVAGARVLLAGGRSALTDAAGRYHFAAVPRGQQALRLDPQSVRNAPLSVPQDGGLPGSRSVMVLNLTSVDFPLAPAGGDAHSVRSTTVARGDVVLRKQLTWLGDDRYAAQLTLSAPRAVPGLEVADPLPAGAILTSGQAGFAVDFAGGSMTTSYTFTFSGTPEQAGTDPFLRWRLP
ncbi:hypothetical protein CBQ26_07515 [Deinococcus indicus]|uniref:DUF11 domain-containing protein n=1 Tax=Deinococcus indicus TaxID=223556 RepID=A0A246BME3_9DEIO|nr:DUF11 domain-containing protein [Deinococcus indicus]OWL96833.1 hypothetical protein CBQ26_07515 [Deinococcus indicus]